MLEKELGDTRIIASGLGRPGFSAVPPAVRVPAVAPSRRRGRRRSRPSGQPVGLRREDEVALGQAVDLVRPDLDQYLAPGEVEVGVVVLLLGQLAHAGGEVERLPEVR